MMDIRYYILIKSLIYISYAIENPLITHSRSQHETIASTIADKLNKRIIVWTKYFGSNHPLPNMQSKENCQKQCVITTDRTNYQNAAAIVFHWRDLDPYDLPEIRNQQQRYVYENLESPINTVQKYDSVHDNWALNFFNWTITYRSDSDIYAVYDRLLRKDAIQLPGHEYHIYEWNDVRNAIAKKDKMILQLVSNCYSHSGREAVVSELQKYIDVSIFGKCSNILCDSKCEKEMLGRHRFYLAFENSLCDEYVSEKVWKMKQLIVPIVLRAKDYLMLLPNGSFLAVDQFTSIYHLAMRLHELASNISEYERFFEWTKEYQYTSLSNGYKFCELCEKLYADNVTKIYTDIQEWWQGNSSTSYCITIAAPWNLKLIREIIYILVLIAVVIYLALHYKSYARFLRRRKGHLTRTVSKIDFSSRNLFSFEQTT